MELNLSEVRRGIKWVKYAGSCFFWLGALGSAALGDDSHGVRSTLSVTGPDGTSRAHVGDTVTATFQFVNMDLLLDTYTVNRVFDLDCEAAAPAGSTTCNLLTNAITLDSFAMFGGTNTLEITGSFPVPDGTADSLARSLLVDWTDNDDGMNGSSNAVPHHDVLRNELRVLRPAIRVSANGSVNNSGNTPLNNVVVSNRVNGVFTHVAGPITLGVGEVMRFHPDAGTTVTPGVSINQMVYAWGTDELGLTVSNSVSITRLVIGVSHTGGVVLTWNTVPGRTYQVEYTTSLSQVSWSSLGDPIVASGESASAFDSIVLDGTRFYRVAVRQ